METGGHRDPLREDPRVAFIGAAPWHGSIQTAVLGDDYDGAKWLLEPGAEPNLVRCSDRYPLHHALARDNSLEMIALLIDPGPDPSRHADAGELLKARGRG